MQRPWKYPCLKIHSPCTVPLDGRYSPFEKALKGFYILYEQEPGELC